MKQRAWTNWMNIRKKLFNCSRLRIIHMFYSFTVISFMRPCIIHLGSVLFASTLNINKILNMFTGSANKTGYSGNKWKWKRWWCLWWGHFRICRVSAFATEIWNLQTCSFSIMDTLRSLILVSPKTSSSLRMMEVMPQRRPSVAHLSTCHRSCGRLMLWTVILALPSTIYIRVMYSLLAFSFINLLLWKM